MELRPGMMVIIPNAGKLEFPGKFDAFWLGPYLVREAFPNNSLQLETLNGENFPTCTSRNKCKGYRAWIVNFSRTSPKGCLKDHGHKGDPGVTPGTCGADGENAQVFLVWVRASGVGNASHPRRLGVMRVRPWAMHSSWRAISRMLKITSNGGVS